MTLRLVPLASSLNPPQVVQNTVDRVLEQLRSAGIPSVRADDAPKTAQALEELPVAYFLVTGGTEQLVLERITADAPPDAPVLLVAHPSQNSLPACLEVLARLHQSGRRGTILLVNGRPQGWDHIRRVLAACKAHQTLSQARLGVVGTPSDWLVASVPDPWSVRQTWGPRLVAVPMEEVLDATSAGQDAEAEALLADLTAQASGVVEPDQADLRLAARVAIATRQVAERHGLQALTMRCFDLVTQLKTTGCLALSLLLDQGLIAGCEGDVAGALTMMWLHALTGELPFLANPQDLDPSDNSLWVAHCTIARSLVDRYRIRSHFESSLGVAFEGHLPPQPVTLARIGGVDLRHVFASNAALVETEVAADRCRTQLRLRLADDVTTLLRQPLGNHHVVVRGHWAEMVRVYRELFVAEGAVGA